LKSRFSSVRNRMSNLVFLRLCWRKSSRAASHHGKKLKLDPAIMAGRW